MFQRLRVAMTLGRRSACAATHSSVLARLVFSLGDAAAATVAG